jgi:hypothetical protein
MVMLRGSTETHIPSRIKGRRPNRAAPFSYDINMPIPMITIPSVINTTPAQISRPASSIAEHPVELAGPLGALAGLGEIATATSDTVQDCRGTVMGGRIGIGQRRHQFEPVRLALFVH